MLASHRAYPTIPASDLGRAKAWYSAKLGLHPAMEDPAGLFFELAGGTGFLLYATSFAGQAPNTLMTFTSDSLEADVAALRGKGVTFEEYDFPGLKTVNGIAQMGSIRSAWFKDSEGNILAIGTRPGQ